jgi:hypothetical protein
MKRILGLLSVVAIVGSCSASNEFKACESYYSALAVGLEFSRDARIALFEGLGAQAVGTPIGRMFSEHAKSYESLKYWEEAYERDYRTTGGQPSQYTEDLTRGTIQIVEEQRKELIERCDQVLSE